MLGNIKKLLIAPAKRRHQYGVSKSKNSADKKSDTQKIPARIPVADKTLIGKKPNAKENGGKGEQNKRMGRSAMKKNLGKRRFFYKQKQAQRDGQQEDR